MLNSSKPRNVSTNIDAYCKMSLPSFERVVIVHSTAWPQISGQVLSSHSIISSSRTVGPCSPCGARWIGHWRTTWSTVCSSAQHSQAAEDAMHHCTLEAGEGLRLPDVLERQGLSLNLLSKLVMSLILEKHLVVLKYFPASLKILE